MADRRQRSRLRRKVEELEKQLEHERLKREKRELELDECRHEIARLINTLRAMEDKKAQARPATEQRPARPKKSSSAKRSRHTEKETGVVFLRPNSRHS